jgi:hypothetical protein
MSEPEETRHNGGADQQRDLPISQGIGEDRSSASSGGALSTSSGNLTARGGGGGASITEVAAGYITALVVLVYPTGLLTFAAQIWTSYGYAPSTSFFAASLAPTAVVAAKVAHSLVWFAVALVAVGIILGKRSGALSGGRYQLPQRLRTTTIIVAIAVLAVPLSAGTPIATSIFGHTDLFTQRGLILYGVFVVFVGIGGFVGAVWVDEFAGAMGWARFVAFVPVYLATLLAAIVLAGAQGSSLPRVRLGREQATDVRLLSHSQGYWYVFDKQGKLLAIPDDKTGSIGFPKKQSESWLGL